MSRRGSSIVYGGDIKPCTREVPGIKSLICQCTNCLLTNRLGLCTDCIIESQKAGQTPMDYLSLRDIKMQVSISPMQWTKVHSHLTNLFPDEIFPKESLLGIILKKISLCVETLHGYPFPSESLNPEIYHNYQVLKEVLALLPYIMVRVAK